MYIHVHVCYCKISESLFLRNVHVCTIGVKKTLHIVIIRQFFHRCFSIAIKWLACCPVYKRWLRQCGKLTLVLAATSCVTVYTTLEALERERWFSAYAKNISDHHAAPSQVDLSPGVSQLSVCSCCNISKHPSLTVCPTMLSLANRLVA